MKNNFPLKQNNPMNNPGLIIDLGQTKILKSIPAKTISANEIQIKYITDKYQEKKIIAYTNSILGEIVLWEGADYDAIGQWTDDDVKNRIFEILGITI